MVDIAKDSSQLDNTDSSYVWSLWSCSVMSDLTMSLTSLLVWVVDRYLKLDELAVGYKTLPQDEARFQAICLREKAKNG